MVEQTRLLKPLQLLALNVLLLSIWQSTPAALAGSLQSLLLVLFLTVPLVYRQEVGSFLQSWHKRNIIKGDSAFIHKLHMERNEQILRLGTNEFSVADPALIDTIYRDRSFLKSEQYAAFDVDGQSTLFSMRDPVEHAKRAKAVAPLFKGAEIIKHERRIQDAAERFCDLMQEAKNKEGQVNVLPYMRGYSSTLIAKVALGTPSATKDKDAQWGFVMGRFIDAVNGAVPFGRSKAPLIRLMDAFVKMLRPFMTRIGATTSHDPTIEAETRAAFERMDAYCTHEATKLVSSPYRDLLLAVGVQPGKAIEADIADLLFAGTDSTSTTLSLGLHYIYNDNRILRKLYAELAPLTIEESRTNAYMNAVVDECLRLAQPVPRRLPRIVPFGKDIFYKEDKLDDGWEKIIPATATVGISAYTLHRHSAFRDALVFAPERWLPEPAEGTAEPDSIYYSTAQQRFKMRQCFVPFGKGVRACIGQELARAELRIMIHTFVCRFEGCAVGSVPDCIDNFNATIKGGAVVLNVKPRRSQNTR